MEVVMRKSTKTYLLFLWLGFILAILLAVGIYFYQEKIANNTILMLLVLFLSLPVGIAHLSLLIDILGRYRYKLFPVAFLLLWPRLFISVLVIGPFIYLIYLSTLAYNNRKKPLR